MKLLTTIFTAVCLFATGSSFGQCNDQLVDIALEAIDQKPSDKFTYLKDFKVRLKKSKKNKPEAAKYTVILSKGTLYRFTTANAKEYPGNLIWTLYDTNGLVMTNYVVSSNKVYATVDMTCKKSGRYYLTYTFEDGKEGCGVGLLSFKNKSQSIDELLDY